MFAAGNSYGCRCELLVAGDWLVAIPELGDSTMDFAHVCLLDASNPCEVYSHVDFFSESVRTNILRVMARWFAFLIFFSCVITTFLLNSLLVKLSPCEGQAKF